jgi:hypothetical protein
MDVQAGGFVSEIDQDIPERETIFAPGDGHQQAVVVREHVLFFDGPGDLIGEVFLKAGLTEGGIVATDVDEGLFTTLHTLHRSTLLR